MSNPLVFDESFYGTLSEVQKPVFLFDWLRSLENSLLSEDKKSIREFQEDLVQQLLNFLSSTYSDPIQKLLGRCLSKLCLIGDSLLLYTVVNTCNNLLKTRDDGSSCTSGRLAALTCLGAVYKHMGRSIGGSLQDSIVSMVKLVKQSESQVRSETINTLCCLLDGVSCVALNSLKDIHKCAKSCLTDRVLYVRYAAAKCLGSLVDHYVPLHTTGLETMVNLCFRAMDGSDHAVRVEVAKLIGKLVAKSQKRQCPPTSSPVLTTASTSAGISKIKMVPLSEALSMLASGFHKGPSGFLKGSAASDVIKGVSNVNREVRVGVTYAYMEFVHAMGGTWFESNLELVISHCTSLLSHPRSVPSPTEAVFSRHCIHYLLCTLYRRLLSEPFQLIAARCLLSIIRRELQVIGEESAVDFPRNSHSVEDNKDQNIVEDSSDSINDEIPGTGESGPSPNHDSSSTRFGSGRINARAQRQQRAQHVLVCALNQLCQLIQWLDSISASLLDPPSKLDHVLRASLSHPMAAVRMAAANCLRQLTLALPVQRVCCLNPCIAGLQSAHRPPGDMVLGYTAAIAGIVGGAAIDSFGLPASRIKQVFATVEDLFRMAKQNSRLTLQRTQAAWLLLAAFMKLGPTVVRPHLPRIFLFWRNTFPRTAREMEAEKQRGDAFTWQIMLEARAGALCSVQSFLRSCASILVSEEAVNHVLVPVECALNMLGHLLDIVRLYGNHLKATADLIRYRLYLILLHLPTNVYTSSYGTLLRELVAEFTLTDNVANTTTSLLRHLCRSDDSGAFNLWAPDSDQKFLEDQLSCNHAPGTLEHDPAYLFLNDYSGLVTDSSDGIGEETSFLHDGMKSFTSPTTQSNKCCTVISGAPLPINVACIDAAVELFGRTFPTVPIRHRIQMMEHFHECIRVARSTRQEAIQINIFSALLTALRQMSETKSSFGNDVELRTASVNLIMGALSSSNQLLRCAAGECLGRVAQLTGEPAFLADLAQQLFTNLRTIRAPSSRAGHSLAVGCLHRYVGGFASGQLLSASVGILLSIAQDSSVPEVQVWALHALTLLADSGGPLFREYVDPSLNLVLQLLLRSSATVSEIRRSLGRLLSALITTLGPELQGTGPQIVTTKHSCILCCLIMHDSSDPLLKAEAVCCLHRIHMFVPQQAQLPGIIPELLDYVSDTNLSLRRSTVSYLRQLCQKQPMILSLLLPVQDTARKSGDKPQRLSVELHLFDRLNVETDFQVLRDLEEIIMTSIQFSASSHLDHWMSVFKEILQASTSRPTGKTELRSPADPTEVKQVTSHADRQNEPPAAQCDPNENAQSFTGTMPTEAGESAGFSWRVNPAFPDVKPVESRWPTRVFALRCMSQILTACSDLLRTAIANARRTPADPALVNILPHFDLSLARDLSKRHTWSDPKWLVFCLPDFIRLSTMAATSDSDRLRVSGLRLLHEVIELFGCVADPDFDGHFLLEQYQAQVSAAIRPVISLPLRNNDEAFSDHDEAADRRPSATPELASLACLVCSSWLLSMLAREKPDIQRCMEILLLATSQMDLDHFPCDLDDVGKLYGSSTSQSSDTFSDDAILLERLSVLRAWADLYISATLCERCSIADAETTVPPLDSRNDARDESDSDGFQLGFLPGLQFRNLIPFLRTNSVLIRLKCPSDCYIHSTILAILHPLLPRLGTAWLAAVKDYALIHLPDKLLSPNTVNSGVFFTSQSNLERIRSHYIQHHPVLLRAACLWIHREITRTSDGPINTQKQHFNLLLGSCVELITDTNLAYSIRSKNSCLLSLLDLLHSATARSILFDKSPMVPLELIHILHRHLVITNDSETQLLCTNILHRILIAAEENLARRREAWLLLDSENAKVNLTPGTYSVAESQVAAMCSSSIVQTSGCLPDARVYELAEGGQLFTFFNGVDNPKNDITAAASLSPPGLRTETSVVFAALEMIIDAFSKYQPGAISKLRHKLASPGSPDSVHPTFRNHSANDSTAASLLTFTVRCLSKLPDLCAPCVLLSSLSLPSAQIDAECQDNLLIVLLDLLVAVMKEAIVQYTKNPNISTAVGESSDLTDTTWQAWMASNTLSLCENNSVDSEISSTASCSIPNGSMLQNQSDSPVRRHRADALLSWTAAQSSLFDALVHLAVALAAHQYPALVLSVNLTPAIPDDSLDHPSDSCPDSSCPDTEASCLDKSKNKSLNGSTQQPMASRRWYTLVAHGLLELLRSNGTNSDDPQNKLCDLAALILVCRICKRCPRVFLCNTEEFQTALVDGVISLWSRMETTAEPHLKGPVSPFNDTEARHICLIAIKSLINHPDASIHGFFIKKLTPQIFRWLCDISTPTSTDKSSTLVSKTSLTECIEIAVRILLDVVDKTDPSGRQSLLLILLPLLCNLLLEAVPDKCVIDEWNKASEVAVGSCELQWGLHMCAVRQLMSVATRFPSEFRSAFNVLGDFKLRFEKALKHSVSSSDNVHTSLRNSAQKPSQRPAIQLKTDFSNFASP